MDKNNGKDTLSEEKNNFYTDLSRLEQLFNLAALLPLLILSIIITVVSFQIGIFTELNTKSTLLILAFRFGFTLAIPFVWVGLVSLIIKYLARPSPTRRYILEGIVCRLEIAIENTIIKSVDWFDNNLSSAVNSWLEGKKERKLRRLEKWKEWSECRNISHSTKDPLPVSLFGKNDED